MVGDAGDDVVLGDSGADRVSGGDGADQVAGGLDDDVLVGGPGGDDVRGDDGWDTADYAGRPEALTVDLDDQADDGAKGEGDNVRATVEAVIGGAANDRITGNAATNYLYGEGGNDRLDGGAASDRLYGGAGRDTVIGGAGPDSMDGGDGADRISARDGSREAVRCGSGRDRATTDTVDMLFGCEKRTSGTANWTNTDTGKGARVRGVRARTGGGGFVAIPGFPGERIDRRLLADIAYLQRRYRVHITDGFARKGHADGGEHPIGLAVDIVPGPGGSWSDVDRLARWAEPRQNRPRSPFRWVGYNGDRNHGRGNHLHLSWRHSATRPGRVARTVWTLALSKPAASGSSLASLARTTKQRLGAKPSVSIGLGSPARCSGSAPLVPIFKSAGRAFGISWKVLAGLTEVESGHGCNMGPSSAGAIGWTQFLPSTWRIWGMDATGDQNADPYDARRRYVNKVQRAARKY